MGTLVSALRFWRGHRRVALAIVGILGVPLGLSFAVYGAVESVILDRPVYPSSDRIAVVSITTGPLDSWAGPRFDGWRASTVAFEALAGYLPVSQPISVGATENGGPIHGASITASMFDVLRVRPVLGRAFSHEDEVQRAGDLVIVSYSFWQQALGGRSDAIGARLLFNGNSREVVGVMPPEMDFPARNVAAWFPLSLKARTASTADGRLMAVVPRCQVIGRLAPQATFAQANAEAVRIADPEARVDLMSLASWRSRDVKRPLILLQGITVSVVLCAIANAASLLAALALARRTEISLRFALGASIRNVVTQMLVEGALLAVPTALLSLMTTSLALHLVDNSLRAALLEPRFTVGVGALSLGSAFVAMIVAAINPVLLAARSSGPTSFQLTAGPRGTSRRVVSRAFLIAQTALAGALLVAALSFSESLSAALQAEPAYASEQLVIADLALAPSRLDVNGVQSFVSDLLVWARGLPGVAVAGAVSDFPISGAADDLSLAKVRRSPGSFAMGERSPVRSVVVSGNFFEAMNVSVIRGRLFGGSDGASAPPVAIITEAAAAQRFGSADPLGQSVYFFNKNWTVVGVIGDVRGDPFMKDALGSVYCPLQQLDARAAGLSSLTMLMSLRPGSGRPSDTAIRAGVARINAQVRLDRVSTAHQRFGRLLAPLRIVGGVSLGLAVLAAVISSVGVFALLAFSVRRRQREIGVRMALGASQRQIFKLVMTDAAIIFLVAMPIAIAIAAGVHGSLQSSLEGVRPLDIVVVAAASLSSGLAIFVAALAPARRASRTDPTISLREG